MTLADPESTLRVVRSKVILHLLLAGLVISAGICPCLGAVIESAPPPAHDCGNKPAAPSGQDAQDCQSDCTVADAALAAAKPEPTTGEHGIQLDPPKLVTGTLDLLPESSSDLAPVEAIPPRPPYIVYSSLLL